ncbi:urokinase plasminogen activator surface receptor [Labeo rohita]|nr:urokinase plasminogen activator surface receptor [Labeo rohita]
MALHITLLLTTVFFSKALTLRCYGCITDSTGSCTQTVTCPSRCGATTTNIYVDGRKVGNSSARSCADPVLCVTGSMNSGQSKVTLNSQCCTTDSCNSVNAPDLPQKPLNGKKCFTCNATTDCTRTLACEGDETQCFVTTADVDGKKVTTKGCSSKLLCGNGTLALGLPVQSYGFGTYMKCCEGNLCNGAQSLRVFFLMLVPLLSLLVF